MAVERDASGLLERDELLQTLDRAVTKRMTVISAPPGSGKTSLLRAWADRATDVRRVAFVSVDRDQQDAQRFWSAVLDAIRARRHLGRSCRRNLRRPLARRRPAGRHGPVGARRASADRSC